MPEREMIFHSRKSPPAAEPGKQRKSISVSSYAIFTAREKWPAQIQSEHFHKSCSDELELVDSGLFGFRLRFSSVTGFSNLFLRRSLAENQKSSLLIATSFLSML